MKKGHRPVQCFIPADLRRSLKARAALRGVSITDIVRGLIADYVRGGAL
jgi:hypothetical protein